jgi:ankyrin repeat protein
MLAVQEGHKEVVSLLVDKGADVCVQDKVDICVDVGQ